MLPMNTKTRIMTLSIRRPFDAVSDAAPGDSMR
jgi:hypothetical protein